MPTTIAACEPKTPSADIRDEHLLQTYVKTKCAVALDELFKRNSDAAYRTALRWCGNAADAEDAVQSAFLQVMRHADQYAAQASVRGWIMGIVINACRLKKRDDSNLRERHLAAAGARNNQDASAEPSADPQTIEDVCKVVDGLPRHYRMPICLHFVERLSIREVAESLALPEKTVYSQISRGLELARQSLAAVGYASSVMAIPELLARVPLPHAPSTLAAALKGMIPKAAVAASSKAAAGVGLKIALSTALALTAVISIAAWRRHFDGGETKQDAENRPAGIKQAVKDDIDPSLTQLLAKKIDVVCRRDYPQEVLRDLERKYGLHSAIPRTLGESFLFSLEEKQLELKQVLEKFAAAGALTLEQHGATVVFWKKADDNAFSKLSAKLADADVAVRCETVHELGELSDPRIYPLLAKALTDADQAVAIAAARSLYANHLATLPFIADRAAMVAPIEKMLEAPNSYLDARTKLSLLAATRLAPALQFIEQFAAANSSDLLLRCAAIQALQQPDLPELADAEMQMLKDTPPVVRAAAVEALAFTHDKKILESLKAASLDEDANVRACAAFALGRAGLLDPTASPEALIALSKDEQQSVRQISALALGRAADNRCSQQLDHLMIRDSSLSVRCVAGMQLNFNRDQHCIDDIAHLLTGSDSILSDTLTRRYHAYEFAQTRDEALIEPLVALLHNGNPHIRMIAAYTLGMLHLQAALAPLKTLINDGMGVKSVAVFAVGHTRSAEAVEVLRTQIASANDGLIAMAAFSLGAVRDADAVSELLAPLLKSKSPPVRVNATYALAESRDSKVLPQILPLAQDPSPDVRAKLAFVLGHRFRSSDVLAPLIELLTDPSATVRPVAEQALIELADPRSTPLLIARLSDANADIQAAAAHALGGQPDPRALPALTIALHDKDANVRSNAVYAIGNMAPANGVELLETALADPSLVVRKSLALALARIRSRPALECIQKLMLDADRDVVVSAADALCRIQTVDAAGLAVSTLGQPSLSADALVDALSHQPERELNEPGDAVDTAIACLKTSSPGMQLIGAQSLAELSAASPIAARFDDERNPVMSADLALVLSTADPCIIAPLCSIRERGRPEIRSSPAYILNQENPALSDALLAYFKNNVGEKRLNAQHAVERTQDGKATKALKSLGVSEQASSPPKAEKPPAPPRDF